MKTSSPFARGYLIALSGTVLWSFTDILISYLSKTYGLPSLVLAFWRDRFVSFTLVAAFSVRSPQGFALDPRNRVFMVIWGLTLAVFNSQWNSTALPSRPCSPSVRLP